MTDRSNLLHALAMVLVGVDGSPYPWPQHEAGVDRLLAAIDAAGFAITPKPTRPSWACRNACQGLFGEAFYSRERADQELAVARGGDLSPDWRVVPVWLVEIEPHTAEFHAAHEDEDFRERSEVRAKALSDLAAMDGEHL